MEIKKIRSPEDFQMAMSAVQSSLQLLGMFDWETLVREINFFESVGPMLNPTMFIEMQKDPQWETKKEVFRAVANYLSALDAARRSLDAS